MTITPSNLHLIILLILALPAILCLLLILLSKSFKAYSEFFVKDPLVKQKLEKFIIPNYEYDEYCEFDYIELGFVGFISFSLP